MKVQEIVTEAGIIGTAAKYALPYIGRAIKGVAAPSGPVARSVSSAEKMAIRQVKSLGYNPSSPMGKFMVWMQKRANIKDMARYQWAAKEKAAAHLGDNLFGWANKIGIAYAIYDYWTASEALAASGLPEEEKETKLSELRANLVGTIVLPKVIGWIGKATVGNATNVLSWLVSKAGVTGIKAASMMRIVKDIALKGGVAGLTAWLQTGQGKDWFRNVLEGGLFGVAKTIGDIGAFVGKLAHTAAQTAVDNMPGSTGSAEPTKKDPYAGTSLAGHSSRL